MNRGPQQQAHALYGAAFDLAQRHKLFQPKNLCLRSMPAL
ncbi:hypothetical protein M2375_002142 [Comamonas sp. BIGb0152]|nr:hypothetical protein [Comamonas sp. BIGb0152]